MCLYPTLFKTQTGPRSSDTARQTKQTYYLSPKPTSQTDLTSPYISQPPKWFSPERHGTLQQVHRVTQYILDAFENNKYYLAVILNEVGLWSASAPRSPFVPAIVQVIEVFLGWQKVRRLLQVQVFPKEAYSVRSYRTHTRTTCQWYRAST